MGYNVFLATPKGMEDAEVDSYYQTVVQKFTPALDGIELSVVKAEDDYRENFGRCGGWDAWTQDVGRGVDYLARTPRYNCIACVQQAVGKATADIVRHAIEADRMVVLVNPNKTVDRVIAVETIDSNDYRSGWFLRIDN